MKDFDVPAALPWWKSRVIMGALVSAVLKILAMFVPALAISGEETQAVVTLLMLAASLIGDGVAIHARSVQKYAPPIASGGGARLRSPMLAGIAALALVLLTLPGCADMAPPLSAGDGVEQSEGSGTIAAKLYTGWRNALDIGIATGLIDEALGARLRTYDVLIRGALEAVALARGTGDADSAAAALAAVKQLIGEAMGLSKDGDPAG